MTLARLLIRRHRGWTLAWVGVIGLLCMTFSSYAGAYSTTQARELAVEAAQQTAASTLLYGRLESPGTPAQIFAWEIGAFLTLLAGVCGVLLAARLSRATEEDGTLELIRSCGVRPVTPHLATWGYLGGVASVLALCVTLIVGRHAPLDGVTWSGSVTLGATVGVTFLALAAATVLIAQVLPSAGQARAAGLGILAISFAQRAFGDLRGIPGIASWSPLGLRGAVRPMTDDRLTPLLMALSCAGLVAVTATALALRREYAASLLPARPAADRRLRIDGLGGLWWRLHGAGLTAWVAVGAVLVPLFVAMGSGVVDSASRGDLSGGFLAEQMAGTEPVEASPSYLGTVAALVVSVYAALTVLRAATEEHSGLSETVRGTGIAPERPLATAAAWAALGSFVGLLAAGVMSAWVAPAVLSGPHVAESAVRHLVGQWPGVAALVGVATAVVGLRSTAGALVWVGYGGSAVLVLLGSLLHAPTWLIDASVFGHVPSVGWISAAQLVLLAVGALGCAVGLTGIRHRDLAC